MTIATNARRSVELDDEPDDEVDVDVDDEVDGCVVCAVVVLVESAEKQEGVCAAVEDAELDVATWA
jgi:hypothetical protein